jgi:hypothetical protein
MSQHVTPIKYEAITPDLFCLLLRTTAKDSQQHYFVLLEYDYIPTNEKAREIIEQWHGPVLEFLFPIGAGDHDALTLANASFDYDRPYKALPLT